MADTRIAIGAITLKNPVIAGSGEASMTGAGMRALIAAGAGAVVAKSVNESEAARRQLDGTDYALLDARWNRLPWDFNPPADASLFCRSGLAQVEFEPWLKLLVELDREAKAAGSMIIPSVILADLDRCVEFVRRFDAAGLRMVEVNIGAPHGEEAARGAIVLERDAARVQRITERVRAATRLPLWIKLTGQSEDVTGLAQAAKDGGADAVILMGRYMGMLPDLDTQAPLLGTSGAIGGGWALPLTCRWLAMTRKRLGRGYPLIATNGARNGSDVARFLLAGASAVEMTSAVLAGGARAIAESVAGFEAYLDSKQQAAQALVGLAADRLQTYAEQASRPGYWKEFVEPAARG